MFEDLLGMDQERMRHRQAQIHDAIGDESQTPRLLQRALDGLSRSYARREDEAAREQERDQEDAAARAECEAEQSIHGAELEQIERALERPRRDGGDEQGGEEDPEVGHQQPIAVVEIACEIGQLACEALGAQVGESDA
jgi:hypothetical protein